MNNEMKVYVKAKGYFGTSYEYFPTNNINALKKWLSNRYVSYEILGITQCNEVVCS